MATEIMIVITSTAVIIVEIVLNGILLILKYVNRFSIVLFLIIPRFTKNNIVSNKNHKSIRIRNNEDIKFVPLSILFNNNGGFKMCQQKKLKSVALILALNVMFFSVFSGIQKINHINVVHAEESAVSTYFFRAVLVMMGITAYMQGTMSSTFSIPETDLLALKDQFAQTLEADAAKKSAWMQAQTDYLAGGVAKTMGAVELAKIGVNDIYDQFKNYISNNVPLKGELLVGEKYSISSEILNQNYYDQMMMIPSYTLSNGLYYSDVSMSGYADNTSTYNLLFHYNSQNVGSAQFIRSGWSGYWVINMGSTTDYKFRQAIYLTLLSYGIDYSLKDPNYINETNSIIGTINNDSLINSTDTTRSMLPTIPWIDTAVPVGTIVTPEIAAPYAGTVPIDVPITAPIDPPIEEPETPSYPDVLSATLAILAALTPISAILDNIDLGIGDIDDVIDAGNTAIADGIDDIINSITGSVTDIGTIVEPITSTLDKIFDPPSKDIDWDKLKNIEIFNKFPFSIPSDFYFLMSMLASDPIAPRVEIDLDLSFIGAGVKTYAYDLSQFDNFAQVLRSFELLAFVFFLLYSTKNLIWK